MVKHQLFYGIKLGVGGIIVDLEYRQYTLQVHGYFLNSLFERPLFDTFQGLPALACLVPLRSAAV